MIPRSAILVQQFVFRPGQILWDNVKAPTLPFQFKLGLNECYFGLPLWAVIQLTLSMRILYTRSPLVTMRIEEVKRITAHNNGKPKWHSFTSSLSCKRENFGLRHCLTKCALENKLLNQNCWSWYHFTQEKLPHTLISVIAATLLKYAVPFLWATLYIRHML